MIDEFAKIKSKYIKTFEQKARDLEEAIEDKTGNSETPQLHDLLHKLTGSSGGYGLDDLCELSRQAMVLSDLNDTESESELIDCVGEITELLRKYHQQ